MVRHSFGVARGMTMAWDTRHARLPSLEGRGRGGSARGVRACDPESDPPPTPPFQGGEEARSSAWDDSRTAALPKSGDRLAATPQPGVPLPRYQLIRFFPEERERAGFIRSYTTAFSSTRWT